MVIPATAYCITGVVCFYLLSRMVCQSFKDTHKALNWFKEELKK